MRAPRQRDADETPITGQSENALRIIVVDDDPIQRAMAAYYLEKHGAQVRQASDGMECLKILAVEQFDILLTDVDMPNMNGLDLLDQVRGDAWHNEMMLAIITSRTDLSEFRARRHGAEFVTRKPVNWHSLATDLAKTYGERACGSKD